MSGGPALPDVGLIAIVPDQWVPEWQARHHIVSRLAAYFQTVWCNPPSAWQDTSRHTPWLRPFRTQRGPTGASFSIYTPPAWAPEIHRSSRLDNATWGIRLRQVARYLRQRGARRTVLAIWRPALAPALQAGIHDFSIYVIDDEYTFSDDPVPTPPEEAALARAVDQVLVHSPGLLEKKGLLNPYTVRIPLGVDYARFAAAPEGPDPFAAIPHPRLVYLGRIKKNLDWAAMELVLRSQPEWQVVLCGTRSPHPELEPILQRLSGFPNFHLLPGRPSGEVPALLSRADVCILPYAFTAYNDCIYPLKLHECFATGRPVVGSAIRSLQEFEGVMHLTRTPPDWLRAIAAALGEADNSSAAVERRRAIARQHDWVPLVRRFAEIIATRLGATLPADRSP